MTEKLFFTLGVEMSGRNGILYAAATGQKLDGFEDLPEVLKREIRNNYRIYLEPPPANDQRHN